jgi:DNA-binding FadR family transcriptional regulator
VTQRHTHVVQTLGSRIVQQQVAEGEVLPTEDELVREYSVGRSALREGVKVLAGKGLIESRTSAGTRVRPRTSWNLLDADVLRWRLSADDPADLATIADLRVALEPGAALLAAESDDLAARRAVGVAMGTLWSTVDDQSAFVEADLAFHRSVFVAAGNDLLLYVHDAVADALNSVRHLHTHSAGHNRETLPDHEDVADAIAKGHRRKAEAAMRIVVERARDDLLGPGRP